MPFTNSQIRTLLLMDYTRIPDKNGDWFRTNKKIINDIPYHFSLFPSGGLHFSYYADDGNITPALQLKLLKKEASILTSHNIEITMFVYNGLYILYGKNRENVASRYYTKVLKENGFYVDNNNEWILPCWDRDTPTKDPNYYIIAEIDDDYEPTEITLKFKSGTYIYDSVEQRKRFHIILSKIVNSYNYNQRVKFGYKIKGQPRINYFDNENKNKKSEQFNDSYDDANERRYEQNRQQNHDSWWDNFWNKASDTSNQFNWLSVFGYTVAPANFSTVKEKYRELTKKYHPDVNHNGQKTEEKMKELNEAIDQAKRFYRVN